MAEKITVSVIKADVGGYVGHSSMHPDLIATAEASLGKAKKAGTLIDVHVTRVGDDIEFIMTHRHGTDATVVHELAWNIFVECTEVAKKLKLYGAGQDLLSDAFSGNVKGMGPGVAEMEFVERKAEPILIFMADKTSPGAWNYPVFKMFADPFNTAGLVIDPSMHDGFNFVVMDVMKNRRITFSCPEEMYDLLVLIGAPEYYIIQSVHRKSDNDICAVSSTQRLALIAGRYVGKDDPVLIVRAQSGLPAVGEVLEPFAFPHAVAGWMRGSHQGPLMPTSFDSANPSRFDGPPRVICAGFQLADGKLVGPRDMFDDPSFDHTRMMANYIADYLRRHGPFEPHRLPLEEMEYTTMPGVMEKLEDRFEKV
ncbi:fructose 1,6-bisphosphatase [candidate division TA06 bacterium DG_24]|jgi:fructose 1,6-bisphosphate aldolase/phosphatase|uniref:Fructose-1,6-bisphosphate aldolase/phosphatase n=3 Tax=Bacteria division TA06 TaxID=1156500 RepID=A0A0S8JAC1_UNCT6|nr:MAG: fructose 1,6-bisphosphatase [candidate division TA06 bacterium DG_24]KPK67638.1 MAG: fructose 1,6-bisphosphatase [candidate division TA06 bacterium SM23_40]KPL06705.1 MAG: fructose 1,6-bisphosphatase [candidate division TA06 bacterium SM1_40]